MPAASACQIPLEDLLDCVKPLEAPEALGLAGLKLLKAAENCSGILEWPEPVLH